jgi:hypothetical protein
MTSPNELKRPRELEFALSFCGDPEETIARQYIEALEARVALAQPEPRAGSSNGLAQELLSIDDLRDAWNAQSDAFNSWDELGIDEIIWFAQQQAIARYAHPAIQPVPVAERPWEREGWRDADGRCWWGRPSEELCNSDWHLATRAEVEEFCSDCIPIVSRPAHALPIP